MKLTTFVAFLEIVIFINFVNALEHMVPKGKGNVLDYYESCPDKPLPSPDKYAKYELEIEESEEEGDLLLLNGEVSLTKPLHEAQKIKSHFIAEVKKRGFWTQIPYTLTLEDTCDQFWTDYQLWDNIKTDLSQEQKNCPIKVGEIYKFNNTKMQGLIYSTHESVPEGIYRITARVTAYFTDYIEDFCIRFFANYKKL